MKYKIFLKINKSIALCLLFFSLLLSCISTVEKKPVVEEQTLAITAPKAVHIGEVSLYKKYAPYFSIGVAVSSIDTKKEDKILQFHFNHLTLENHMKFGSIHPREDRYYFKVPDTVADYAREHDMHLCGHTLVWHSQQPKWLFSDLSPGKAEDIAILQQRLKDHIETLVQRYGDIVDNWDVVNEAISETEGKMYRDASEGSNWYKIFRSKEYIYWAFKYTRDALDAYGSTAKMYYNDYNTYKPEKLAKILSMIQWLKDEKGIKVDGIGFQGHWAIGIPAADVIRNAFETIINAGLEIKISELDISIYPKDDWENRRWEPKKEFTKQLEEEQAAYYKDIFTLFREYSRHISEVTFWGLSDDRSWLDRFPTIRNNYPLLFDDDHNVKKAYYAIIDF